MTTVRCTIAATQARARADARPGYDIRAGLFVTFGLVLAALAIFAATLPARSQTVSCATADKPAEFAICNSEQLQVLDEKVDAAFSQELGNVASRSGRQDLSRQQARWTLRRDACKADQHCLEKSYERRLAELDAKAPLGAPIPIASFKRFAGNGG